MNDEMKEQLENLYEEPSFIELIEIVEPEDLKALAESYLCQECPFAEMEAEE